MLVTQFVLPLRGAGVGDGPLRSMWSSLIRHIVVDSGHWVEIGDKLYTPFITSLPPSENDITAFKTYGYIMRLALLWGLEYLPFSPFILLYLLEDYAAATSSSFIQSIAPETFSRLATWSPDLSSGFSEMHEHLIIPGRDPMNLIIESGENLQVFANFSVLVLNFYNLRLQPAHMHRLSVEAKNALTARLVSYALFRCQDLQTNHPVLKAIKEGLDCVLTPEMTMLTVSTIFISNLYPV
jgi:hypothetical protein